MFDSSSEGGLAVLLLELFYLIDVVDEVVDFIENGDGFSGDDVSEIFFDLHSELNRIEPIETVVFEGRRGGEALLIRGAEVSSHELQNVLLDVLLLLKSQLCAMDKLAVHVLS